MGVHQSIRVNPAKAKFGSNNIKIFGHDRTVSCIGPFRKSRELQPQCDNYAPETHHDQILCIEREKFDHEVLKTFQQLKLSTPANISPEVRQQNGTGCCCRRCRAAVA